MADQIKWTNVLSTRPSLEAAVEETVAQAEQELGCEPDLGLVFISSAFASEYSRLMPLLQQRLAKAPLLVGCSGGGIVGLSGSRQVRELEGEPALSLTLAKLPGVKVQAFAINGDDLPDLDASPESWVELTGVAPADQPHFILLADPFSSKINDLIQGLDFAYPGSVKVGGLASGGPIIGSTALFYNYQLCREGTVGIALSGNIVMETIVAQGCRPIGSPYRVSAGERNIVMELEEDYGAGTGKPKTALEALRDLISTLSEGDRQLAQDSLFVGVVRDEFKLELESGDFLIRNLLGVDPNTGALAIGDRVRPGQRLQFHLRDAKTSAEDLELLLRKYRHHSAGASAAGALIFSCLGRGERLYGEPDFDSKLFQRYIGNIPISGFFCNGEIGPVGGSTFLHGYTSVFGICRQP
ncbi:MAG TPA: FIST C-terminal domain-containing protein [Oscillatoriaceae cyanobacterium M33_DOE_052]|uniref:Histidine kinase n=1 Tax=Planktothricoides sp. SpSt-374 TaxID=2282167 RepID=A0A7C3ZVL3_9CYAN|nr:FIST C-terminal domain-containing protein [Oscillatoriaceae cyanobacterium M33_DOE_052]